MIGVYAGAIGVKRALEAILEQHEAVHKDGWHIATSQRRDVPTSRRPNVATSPRRDVPTPRRWVNYYADQQEATSRRLNVATLQRRDVSASAVFSSFKSKQDEDFRGIEKRTAEGMEIQSSSDTNHEEEPEICIVSHFWTIEGCFTY